MPIDISTHMPPLPIGLSIIVPAYNNPDDLDVCLAALLADGRPDWEVIVVDDGSRESIREVAAARGVKSLRLDKNSGPSSARNLGAREAGGDILLFVDSDVVVAPGAVASLVDVFDREPTVDAVFGSYDSGPRAKGLISQYRNLLHHYMHQTGSREASTFWGGLGAVRRSAFVAVGGFDEGRFSRCMEDIELGYRLRQGGHRIVMERTIQGTHLKRWTLRSTIRTDVFCRAIPWTRLILEHPGVPADLNLRPGQRASVALVGVTCLSLLVALAFPKALIVALAALLGVLVLNRHLYAFFVHERGVFFTLAVIPLHLLYFVYSGLAYSWVWSEYRLRSFAAPRAIAKETRP
jgi:GT2 family glycosyltransferase